MNHDTLHIIAAAGSGRRFGAPLPKQFCDLNGRPLLMTTIERMRRGRHAADMVLVLHPDYVEMWLEMCHKHNFVSPRVVTGGATRWESVKRALATVDDSIEVITIHDGARPVVSKAIIDSVVDTVKAGHQGALPAVAVTDSIRRVNPDGSSRAVDRATLRAVQTPQAFNAMLLRQAYALPYSPLFTDDASVMEAAGFTDIAVVDGDSHNIKVTRAGDIAIAEMYLREIPEE